MLPTLKVVEPIGLLNEAVTVCEFVQLLDWLKLLVAEDIPLEALQTKDDKVAVPPLVGALLKNEQDVTLFEKLVFMNQRNR